MPRAFGDTACDALVLCTAINVAADVLVAPKGDPLYSLVHLREGATVIEAISRPYPYYNETLVFLDPAALCRALGLKYRQYFLTHVGQAWEQPAPNATHLALLLEEAYTSHKVSLFLQSAVSKGLQPPDPSASRHH